MQIERLAIPGVVQFTPPRFGDHRGYFSVTYNRDELAALGIHSDFCQDNQSWSAAAGTVRGLHFQRPPAEQAKLVRVVQGRVIDVVVDARLGSPSFGLHTKSELSAHNGTQVFVPRGCLHGFVTLEADTIVQYKVDNDYAPGLDGSLAWDDPELGIDWGIERSAATLSEKDANGLSWAQFETPFRFGAQSGDVAR
ncbi:dTDP-4-dehydrorhamnose 3,5-epimerase [Maricaulis sp.]|uniref:dTDP-4-dehydrorhamnose 3,5-epimerase n=1 Tax=Maricaulis sp. TaxID=1486257 RepID=UPI003A908679